MIIDNYIVCSAGNDYGDGGFEVMRLTDNSFFGFATFQHEMFEAFQIKNRFYFKIRNEFYAPIESSYMVVNVNNLY